MKLDGASAKRIKDKHNEQKKRRHEEREKGKQKRSLNPKCKGYQY